MKFNYNIGKMTVLLSAILITGAIAITNNSVRRAAIFYELQWKTSIAYPVANKVQNTKFIEFKYAGSILISIGFILFVREKIWRPSLISQAFWSGNRRR